MDSLQSLAALHTDGRSDGGKYCDDKIDDLLDGFFSGGKIVFCVVMMLSIHSSIFLISCSVIIEEFN